MKGETTIANVNIGVTCCESAINVNCPDSGGKAGWWTDECSHSHGLGWHDCDDPVVLCR